MHPQFPFIVFISPLCCQQSDLSHRSKDFLPRNFARRTRKRFFPCSPCAFSMAFPRAFGCGPAAPGNSRFPGPYVYCRAAQPGSPGNCADYSRPLCPCTAEFAWRSAHFSGSTSPHQTNLPVAFTKQPQALSLRDTGDQRGTPQLILDALEIWRPPPSL